MAAGANDRLYVVYDGRCVLCNGTVARLKTLNAGAELRFVSVQAVERREPEALELPALDKLKVSQLYEKIHVVESSGAVYAGADGVVRILRAVPGWRWAAWLYRIPGLKPLADRLYRFVANRRYDWFGRTDEGCADGACRLPGTGQRMD